MVCSELAIDGVIFFPFSTFVTHVFFLALCIFLCGPSPTDDSLLAEFVTNIPASDAESLVYPKFELGLAVCGL
jgi:hypothetical protein